MNKFESKQSQTNLDADEGWLVQIYGSNRRLLCVLDSSHGWTFLVGLCVGLILSIIWVNAARYSPPTVSVTPTKAPALQVD